MLQSEFKAISIQAVVRHSTLMSMHWHRIWNKSA